MLTSLTKRLSRLAAATQMLRPRTIAQLNRSHQDLQRHVETLEEQVQELRTAALRERQLRAIASADAADAAHLASLDTVLADPHLSAHVTAAIAASPIELEPFSHCVVDGLLPQAYYDALIAGLPPLELFADRPINKQQLTVPFERAPQYSARVWEHMSRRVADQVIGPLVADKFRGLLQQWLHDVLPEGDQAALDGLTLSCSDGRILLRRRGYRILPHRDPKWGFITCLLYLARPGDDERWGTQLYAVDGDAEARDAKPHWIDDTRCRMVQDVTFVPNRALIFLNSHGAHGACIPEDAEPENLERYAYQFRIGPERRPMDRFLSGLSPERRASWSGKMDY
jgi:hypothetical protein